MFSLSQAFLINLLVLGTLNCSAVESAIAQQRPPVVRQGDKVVITPNATDADLAVLSTMHGVKIISFEGGPNNWRSHITDDGLANFEGLSELEVLRLPAANITDAGVAHLKGLTQLRELWLDSNREITEPTPVASSASATIRTATPRLLAAIKAFAISVSVNV